MTSKTLYLGELRVEATHLKSGEIIITDAPTDNNGKGEAFSPTDTIATGLASCMLTIMGIVARDNDVDIKGTLAEVTKTMASDPRRISKVEVKVTLPKMEVSDTFKSFLEKRGRNCPVAKSIHPDIEQVIDFVWL